MAINRDYLSRAVYQASLQTGRGLSRYEAETLVDFFFDLIKKTLLQGEDILLSGFGPFEVRLRPPKEGRNPKTGQKVKIPRRWTVTFKPSRVLRQRLRKID